MRTVPPSSLGPTAYFIAFSRIGCNIRPGTEAWRAQGSISNSKVSRSSKRAFFWWIQSVYVSPGYRRMGVYKALHSYAEAEARQQGNVCGLRLYVDKDNQTAQGVYSGLGMSQNNYDMYEIEF